MVLELAGLAWASFVLALSGALMPGPVLAVTLAGSGRRGFWFGPGVVLGHAILEAPVVVLLAIGLSAVFQNPSVLAVIGAVGAVALTWMGIGLVRQAFRPKVEAAGAGLHGHGSVASGLLTSALNPYWYVWWVTQPTLLLAGAVRLGCLGVAVFFAGHLAADLGWYSLVALGVASGRRFLEGWGHKVLVLVCAIILFIMAGVFLALAVEKSRTVLGPKRGRESFVQSTQRAVPAKDSRPLFGTVWP